MLCCMHTSVTAWSLQVVSNSKPYFGMGVDAGAKMQNDLIDHQMDVIAAYIHALIDA